MLRIAIVAVLLICVWGDFARADQTRKANAWAAVTRDFPVCIHPGTDPEIGVKICTRIIQQFVLEGELLGMIHASRGATYMRKGDQDRGVTDFKKAYELGHRDPGFLNMMRDLGLQP